MTYDINNLHVVVDISDVSYSTKYPGCNAIYLICFDTRFHGLKLANTILSSERVSQCLSLITDGNLSIYWRCMVHILHTVYTVAWIHGSRMGREKERENYKEREGEIEREREGERDIYKERDERKEIETMGKEGERQGK